MSMYVKVFADKAIQTACNKLSTKALLQTGYRSVQECHRALYLAPCSLFCTRTIFNFNFLQTLYSTQMTHFCSKNNVTTDAPDSLHQKDLNTIVNWAKLNCLRLNADKCKSIRLTWRRMSKPEYNLGNSPLECVDSIMLLGCIFQSNLSWDLQVQAVTSKGNRLIGLIRLISGNCPSCESLHLFKTLVQPILD